MSLNARRPEKGGKERRRRGENRELQPEMRQILVSITCHYLKLRVRASIRGVPFSGSALSVSPGEEEKREAKTDDRAPLRRKNVLQLMQ